MPSIRHRCLNLPATDPSAEDAPPAEPLPLEAPSIVLLLDKALAFWITAL